MQNQQLVLRSVRRGIGWACIIIFGLVPGVVSVISFATLGWQGGAPLGFFVFCGIFALLGWRFCLVPQIAAADSGIVVDNPFRRSVIPWEDVTDVVPGPTGLIIRRREGRATIAWAVQKDNLSTGLHKRTHADEVAETLMKMADERNRRGPRSGLRLDIGPG